MQSQNCYAEDAFVVQLKSASTKQLEYTGHEIDWLQRQTMPMFIGLVSTKDSSIELYSLIAAQQLIQFNRRREGIANGLLGGDGLIESYLGIGGW